MEGGVGLGCISLRRRTTLNNPHIGNEATDRTAMRLTDDQRRWGGGWGVGRSAKGERGRERDREAEVKKK